MYKKRDRLPVMISTVALLAVLIFLFSVVSAQEWLEFGGSYNASHHVPNGTKL